MGGDVGMMGYGWRHGGGPLPERWATKLSAVHRAAH